MKTTKLDPAEYLDDATVQAELISEALETGMQSSLPMPSARLPVRVA